MQFSEDGSVASRATAFYHRDKLPVGEVVPGPAVLVQFDSTVVVPPGGARSALPTGDVLSLRLDDLGEGRDGSHRGNDDARRGRHRVRARRPTRARSTRSRRASSRARSTTSRSRLGTSSPACRTRRSSASPRTSASRCSTPRAGRSASALSRRRSSSARSPATCAGSCGSSRSAAKTSNEGDVILQTSPTTALRTSPTSGSACRSFSRGELVGFQSVTTAHHLDVGAMTPGSLRHRGRRRRLRGRACSSRLSRSTTAARQERRGLAPHARQLRASALVVGDMEAQVAACHHRRAALHRDAGGVGSRDGRGGLRGADGLLRAHAAAARSSSFRTGRISAEGFIDGFADDPDPSKTRPADQGDGDRRGRQTMTVDLTGTSPQISDRSINMPFVGTVDVAIYVTLRSILLHMGRCTSMFRRTQGSCVRCASSPPERGSLAVPMFPCATIGRFCPGNIVADTLMRALSPDLPGAGFVPGIGNMKVISYSGVVPTRTTGSTWTSRKGPYGGRLRQRRHRRRRRPLRQHPEQPGRGHRVALPAPRDPATSCSRTAAGPGRWRGGLGSIAGDRVPRRRGGYSLEGDGSTLRRRPGSSAGGDGNARRRFC